jgi:hypothetical protein
MEWMDTYVSVVNGLYRALRKPASFRAVESLYYVLPYALHSMHGKPEHLILVNRDYKPLGCSTERHIIYENYPHLHISTTDPIIAPLIKRAERKKLKIEGSFFLYNTYQESPFNNLQTARTYLKILESIWLTTEGKSYAYSLMRTCDCGLQLRSNAALFACSHCENQKIAYDRFVKLALGVKE